MEPRSFSPPAIPPPPHSAVSAYQWGALIIGAIGVGITGWSLLHRGKSGSSDGEKVETPPDRWLQPGQSFLLLGDSIGVGIQKPLNERSEAYGTKMTTRLKIGSTASYWNNVVEDGDAGYPIIVLSLGSNDAAMANPESEAAAMDSLIAKLSDRGAHILWFPPPSFHADALKPNQQKFQQMLMDRGVIPLDLLGPQPSVASDPMKLHLTPDGYRVLASQIFDALTRA